MVFFNLHMAVSHKNKFLYYRPVAIQFEGFDTILNHFTGPKLFTILYRVLEILTKTSIYSYCNIYEVGSHDCRTCSHVMLYNGFSMVTNTCYMVSENG